MDPRHRKSKQTRQNQFFLRNEFKNQGFWEIPQIKKDNIDLTSIKLIGADHIKNQASHSDITKTVHFFLDDYKIEKFFNYPERYLKRLAQYRYLLTPDYSLYTDLPISIQIINTFKNRWCGSFWQNYGLKVIPTISWGRTNSYEFCFEGIEPHSVVAISTIGCKNFKSLFLGGYYEMIKRIKPENIICFGSPFTEISSEVIHIPYLETTGRKK